ncbi:hypothetical protein PAMA_009021 [Pampus argenteus]
MILCYFMTFTQGRNYLLSEGVTQELVNNASPEAVPPIASQEQKIVNQLSRMIRKVGDTYGNNTEFQDAIDSVARSSGCKWNKFKKVTEKVFEDGITWEKIAVLFYVAGKLALKMVEAHFPQSVKEILRWTVDFFKNNLLGWIREHGGWSKLYSEYMSAVVVHSGSESRAERKKPSVCLRVLPEETLLALSAVLKPPHRTDEKPLLQHHRLRQHSLPAALVCVRARVWKC